jgi:NAD(P)-dependent dehydrogenase (short-subunit alcohol dehydrogenase family)
VPASKWTSNRINSQEGKTAIVTGANSGLGYQTALVLSSKGAAVILACRSLDKGKEAVRQIRQEVPQANLHPEELDLASLSSIHRFSERIHNKFNCLDLLINNAGVMNLPKRLTGDGFEMQFGINHLGHFALTGLLYDLITSGKNSRVVTISSIAHMQGTINFNDLMGDQNYDSFGAYRQSKLANLMFMLELAQRFQNSRASAISVAAHPGLTHTNITSPGAEMRGSRLQKKLSLALSRLFAMPVEKGVLPQLFAATSPDVCNGCYYGPDGFRGMWGYPAEAAVNPAAHDRENARRLWRVSGELTGVTY